MLFTCQLLTAGKKLFKKWLLVILTSAFLYHKSSEREKKDKKFVVVCLFALHKT